MKKFRLSIGQADYEFIRQKKKKLFTINEPSEFDAILNPQAQLRDTGNGIEIFDAHLNNGNMLTIPYHTAARLYFLISQIEEGNLRIKKERM